jgi:hypothetical protein
MPGSQPQLRRRLDLRHHRHPHRRRDRRRRARRGSDLRDAVGGDRDHDGAARARGQTEIQLEAGEDPVELEVEDLDEILDLAEPRPYSQAARHALASTRCSPACQSAALEQLIDRMGLVELADRQILFRQGDPGEPSTCRRGRRGS